MTGCGRGRGGEGDKEEETEEERRVTVVSAFKKQLQAKGNNKEEETEEERQCQLFLWEIYCCCHGRVPWGRRGCS